MKKSRLVSGLLAVVMGVGAFGISPVYAADKTTSTTSSSTKEDEKKAEQASLKEALSKVKKRVKIPKEISEFSYKSQTSRVPLMISHGQRQRIIRKMTKNVLKQFV